MSSPLRLATLGPGLVALGLAAVGCSDGTPRAGSAELAASKKAGADRGGRVLDPGPRGGDVAPTRTRGKGIAGHPAGPAVKNQGMSR
jgi:hypothetical protein